MIVETFPVGPLACNCTILCDDKTKEAIVVDGGDGVPEVTKRLERLGARAKYLVHTHAHIDHIGDLATLREKTGAQGLLHAADVPLYHTLGMQARWVGDGAIWPDDIGRSAAGYMASTGFLIDRCHVLTNMHAVYIDDVVLHPPTGKAVSFAVGQTEGNADAGALQGLKFGMVTVIVQDGVVVQVERTEMMRLRQNRESQVVAIE